LNQNGSQKQLSAFDKLEKAFLLQTEIKKADIDIVYGVDIKGEDPSMENMLNIVKDVDFKYNILQDISDIENPLIEGKFSVIYQDAEALGVDFFMDGEMMIFSLPAFYSKPMYMTYEGYTDYMNSMMSMYGGEGAVTFNMKEMIKDAYDFQEKFYSLEGIEGAENFDKEKYRALVETGLEGILAETEGFEVTVNENGTSKTVKCDGLSLNFNETQLIDFMIPLLEEAKSDEAFKAVIIAKAEQYMAFVMSLYGDTYAEINEAIEDMKNNYESGIANLLEELKLQKDRSDKEMFVTVNKIGIDSKGQIIYWNMTLDLDIALIESLQTNDYSYSAPSNLSSMSITMESIMNSYDKDLEMTDYSNIDEEGLDLIKIMEDPNSQEAQSVIMQITGAAMQQLGTNPLFQAIFQEMGAF
jgi:uncharacterized protein YeeX (DUF496 family)